MTQTETELRLLVRHVTKPSCVALTFSVQITSQMFVILPRIFISMNHYRYGLTTDMAHKHSIIKSVWKIFLNSRITSAGMSSL